MLILMNQAQQGNGMPVDENELFGGSKEFLCLTGEKASFTLKLPKIIKNLRRVGGSQSSCSFMTALKVANGNGFDPEVIDWDPRLGSQSVSKWIEENENELKAYAKKNNGIMMPAFHSLLSEEMMGKIVGEITILISETVYWEGDSLLVTNPLRISLAIEILTGSKINYNVNDLGFVIIDIPKSKPEIIYTNIPELAQQLGLPV